jgi:membrane protease subunit (stomatin/prohibitin family)
MANIRVGNAAAAGAGLGLGLVLANYAFQAVTPLHRTMRQQIVCLKCAGKNPVENKYCWQCGQAFYPSPTIQCPKCGTKVPSMKYCGNCGTRLTEI